MLQIVDGLEVYVVEFDTMPELPITGLTAEEAHGVDVYARCLTQSWRDSWPYLAIPGTLGFDAAHRLPQFTYAAALTDAIETGVITEPGKYGIYLDQSNRKYEIFKIIE